MLLRDYGKTEWARKLNFYTTLQRKEALRYLDLSFDDWVIVSIESYLEREVFYHGKLHGSTTSTLNGKLQRQTCIFDDDADHNSVERYYTTLLISVVAESSVI